MLETVDVQKYLARIGFEGEPRVDLDTLIQLHECHAYSIPFENFSVHLDGHIPTEKDKILNKLLDSGRGGYCYEVNGAFHDLLKAIGFDVRYLTSRAMFGYTELRPRTHMILMVTLDNKHYLADLGFTGMSIVTPLEIKDGALSSGHACIQHRIVEDSERGFILQTMLDDQWAALFSFDLYEQDYIDFLLPNYFNSTSPNSICTQCVIAAIYTPEGRIRMVDSEVKIRLTKESRDISIQSQNQLDDVISSIFNVDVSMIDVERLYQKICAKS